MLHPASGSAARSQRHGCRGFTLIELLVVISIIAILIAITFPLISSVRERVRRTVCASNLRQIGMAVGMYAADYGGFTPPQPWGWGRGGSAEHSPCSFDGTEHMKQIFGIDYFVADVLMPYAGNRSIFTCPSEDRERHGPDCPSWSYCYSSSRTNIDLGPRTAQDYGDTSRVWLACDMWGPGWGCNHTVGTAEDSYYVNVLYLDGHVRGVRNPPYPFFVWSDTDSPKRRPQEQRHDRGGRGRSAGGPPST